MQSVPISGIGVANTTRDAADGEELPITRGERFTLLTEERNKAGATYWFRARNARGRTGHVPAKLLTVTRIGPDPRVYQEWKKRVDSCFEKGGITVTTWRKSMSIPTAAISCKDPTCLQRRVLGATSNSTDDKGFDGRLGACEHDIELFLRADPLYSAKFLRDFQLKWHPDKLERRCAPHVKGALSGVATDMFQILGNLYERRKQFDIGHKPSQRGDGTSGEGDEPFSTSSEQSKWYSYTPPVSTTTPVTASHPPNKENPKAPKPSVDVPMSKPCHTSQAQQQGSKPSSNGYKYSHSNATPAQSAQMPTQKSPDDSEDNAEHKICGAPKPRFHMPYGIPEARNRLVAQTKRHSDTYALVLELKGLPQDYLKEDLQRLLSQFGQFSIAADTPESNATQTVLVELADKNRLYDAVRVLDGYCLEGSSNAANATDAHSFKQPALKAMSADEEQMRIQMNYRADLAQEEGFYGQDDHYYPSSVNSSPVKSTHAQSATGYNCSQPVEDHGPIDEPSTVSVIVTGLPDGLRGLKFVPVTEGCGEMVVFPNADQPDWIDTVKFEMSSDAEAWAIRKKWHGYEGQLSGSFRRWKLSVIFQPHGQDEDVNYGKPSTSDLYYPTFSRTSLFREAEGRLFVSELGGLSMEEVFEVLKEHEGIISNVDILRDPNTDKSIDCGYIQLDSKVDVVEFLEKHKTFDWPFKVERCAGVLLTNEKVEDDMYFAVLGSMEELEPMVYFGAPDNPPATKKIVTKKSGKEREDKSYKSQPEAGPSKQTNAKLDNKPWKGKERAIVESGQTGPVAWGLDTVVAEAPTDAQTSAEGLDGAGVSGPGQKNSEEKQPEPKSEPQSQYMHSSTQTDHTAEDYEKMARILERVKLQQARAASRLTTANDGAVAAESCPTGLQPSPPKKEAQHFDPHATAFRPSTTINGSSADAQSSLQKAKPSNDDEAAPRRSVVDGHPAHQEDDNKLVRQYIPHSLRHQHQTQAQQARDGLFTSKWATGARPPK